MEQGDKRKYLSGQLENLGVFWSYDIKGTGGVNDDILIEKTLIYLDLEEIHLLFELFPYKKIKQVWKDNILSQEPYYQQLNKFFSWFYFKD